MSILTLIVLCLACPRSAPPPSIDEVARINVYADVDRVTAGSRFHIVIDMEVMEGWHTYWRNPGTMGMGPYLDLQLPDTYESAAMCYPRPHRIEQADMVTYGYEGDVLFFVPVQAPGTINAAAIEIRADFTFLVCRESCLIGSHQVTVTIPATADESGVMSPARRARIKDHRKQLPLLLSSRDDITVFFANGHLVVSGKIGDMERVDFYPDKVQGVDVGIPELHCEGEDGFRLLVPVAVKWKNVGDDAVVIRGILLFGEDSHGPSYELDYHLLRPEA